MFYRSWSDWEGVSYVLLRHCLCELGSWATDSVAYNTIHCKWTVYCEVVCFSFDWILCIVTKCKCAFDHLKFSIRSPTAWTALSQQMLALLRPPQTDTSSFDAFAARVAWYLGSTECNSDPDFCMIWVCWKELPTSSHFRIHVQYHTVINTTKIRRLWKRLFLSRSGILLCTVQSLRTKLVSGCTCRSGRVRLND